MKEDKKIKWPLIAAIAFCALALIVAAVLVLTQVIMSDKVSENDDPVISEQEETGAEDEPEDAPGDEFTEEDKTRNAPSGALAALDAFDPETDSKYNVLLMGVDAGEGLTDVIMIYQIDTQAKRINMMSIPRDSRITYNGRTEKINAVHSYGSQQSDPNGGTRGDEYAIRFIKELTGIPIHHYMCITIPAFRQIIDSLDGFDFNVPRKMDYDDNYQNLHIHLEPGMQHLNGAQAEQLVRFRRYTNGDIDRVAMQQNVLKALVEQKVNGSYISKVPEIFRTIRENVSTDMTLPEVIRLANDVLSINTDSADSISSATADGSFGDAGGVSYWVLNNAKLKERIRTTFGYVDGQPVEQ